MQLFWDAVYKPAEEIILENTLRSVLALVPAVSNEELDEPQHVLRTCEKKWKKVSHIPIVGRVSETTEYL